MKVTLIARPSFVGENTEEYQRALASGKGQFVGTDGEKLAEFAGRGCYDSYGKGRDSEAFHANILDQFHPNVLYHSVYSMWIEGVSRNLSHELIRHHVGFSPSQRSTRYVDEGNGKVVDHPAIREALSSLEAEKRADFLDARAAFDVAWRRLYRETIKMLEEVECDRKTAQGAAARYAPNGIETRLTWTGNAAAFLSMIQRRSLKNVVDAEFCLLSAEMLKIMKIEMPRYFAHL
jgi:thymidylate synthase (FAD)